MKVFFKKLLDNAKTPDRGSIGAAGYDLFLCCENPDDIPCPCESIEPGHTKLLHTGLSLEIPKGYWGGIFARSGMASKRGLRPANCVGVIDSDYRGEIMVAMHNDSDETQNLYDGDKIAQLVILPFLPCEFEEVPYLSDTKRSSGGFGSTGNK